MVGNERHLKRAMGVWTGISIVIGLLDQVFSSSKGKFWRPLVAQQVLCGPGLLVVW